MIRAKSRPPSLSRSPISAIAAAPAGSRLVAVRMFSAAAMNAAAASWASSSTRLNAGLAILSTPTGPPASSLSRKLASCWLPSATACAGRPNWAAATCAARSADTAGTGNSAA